MLIRPFLSVATTLFALPCAWSQPADRVAPEPSPSAATRGKPDNSIRWTGNADADWQSLIGRFGAASDRSRAPSAPGDARPSSQQDQVVDLRSMADDALEFRTRHPNTPRAKEAKKLEATALLRATMVGDETVESRATVVANEVIDDAGLAEDDRYQVAVQFETSKTRRFFNDPAGLKRARIEGARRLMAKFPHHSGGYSNLLSVAENESDPDAALGLTEELLGDTVPGAVRMAAQVVHDRAKLPGKSLATLMHQTLDHADFLQGMEGKIVVLYTWAEGSPGSRHQARELMILAPEKVAYLGLPVGEFSLSVSSLAANEQLPGEQISGPPERLLAFARALKTGGLLPFYIVGPDGNIALVSTDLRGLSAKVRLLAE